MCGVRFIDTMTGAGRLCAKGLPTGAFLISAGDFMWSRNCTYRPFAAKLMKNVRFTGW
jgi:hypothetical protein